MSIITLKKNVYNYLEVYMRLWSIHPKYLDTKGLLATWREGLLAKKVLEGNTKGYKNHPQLIRFKNYSDPLLLINAFLTTIYNEAVSRNYNFDKSKINLINLENTIPVTNKQIEYEFQHLLKKLKIRDEKRYHKYKNTKNILSNPIFYIVDGDIESWEIL
jgi:hypothetical protein